MKPTRDVTQAERKLTRRGAPELRQSCASGSGSRDALVKLLFCLGLKDSKPADANKAPRIQTLLVSIV